MTLGARFSVCAAIALFLGATAVPQTYAGFVFTLGNNPQPNEENILFGAKETGNPIVGEIDHLGITATFESTIGQTLNQQSSGQADVEAVDSSGNEINLLNLKLTLGAAFTPWNDIIINPKDGTGTATITINKGLSDETTFDYTLGTGNNFLTITTTGTSTIKSFQIDAADGFKDFRQPRVSSSSFVVPEPASMTLCGIGAVGIGALTWLRRRKLGIV